MTLLAKLPSFTRVKVYKIKLYMITRLEKLKDYLDVSKTRKHQWRILGMNSYICHECGARSTAGMLASTSCKPNGDDNGT